MQHSYQHQVVPKEMHVVVSGSLCRLGHGSPFAAEHQVNTVFVVCLSRCLRATTVSDLDGDGLQPPVLRSPTALLSPISLQYLTHSHRFAEHWQRQVDRCACGYRRHNTASVLPAESIETVSVRVQCFRSMVIVTYLFCNITEITSL